MLRTGHATFVLSKYLEKRRSTQTFINKTILTNLTMEIEMTKITSKGQVVIPQQIREKAGIAEGERFFVYNSEDSIILKRAKKLEASNDIKEFENVFKSMWKTAKERKITKKDIEEEIKAVRSNKINA